MDSCWTKPAADLGAGVSLWELYRFLFLFWFCPLPGIAIKESASVGEQAQRRLVRGVDDLDFYIGDEAIDKPNYATKVRVSSSNAHRFCNDRFFRWCVLVLLLFSGRSVTGWWRTGIWWRSLWSRSSSNTFELNLRTTASSWYEHVCLKSDQSGCSVLCFNVCVCAHRPSLHSTLQRTESTWLRSCSRPSTYLDSISQCRWDTPGPCSVSGSRGVVTWIITTLLLNRFRFSDLNSATDLPTNSKLQAAALTVHSH